MASTLSGFATGDSLILDNVAVTQAVYASTGTDTGTLTLSNGSNTLETLTLAGDYAGQSFFVSQGSGGASVISLLAPQSGTSTTTQTLPDGSTKVSTYTNGTLVEAKVTGIPGQVYTGKDTLFASTGKATTITFTRADASLYATLTYAPDGSYDVTHPNVTGQAYTSSTNSYSAAGTLTKSLYQGVTSEPYTSYTNVYASNGTLTGTTYGGVTGQPYTSYTDQYGVAGKLASIAFTRTDGSTYAVLTYAADGTYSVAHPGVTGQAYTALTNVYAANGTLTGSTASGYTAGSYDTADTAYASNGKPVFEAFTKAGVVTKTEAFTASGSPGTITDYAAAGAGSVTNAGLFEKLGTTDTWLVNALLNNTGTVDAESGGLTLKQGGVNNGTISVGSGAQVTSLGALTGGGEVDLHGGGTFDLGAGSTNTFVYTDASSSTLRLDDAKDFSGAIKGFSAKSGLDLTGFDAASTFVYTANQAHTGGVLAVSDGALHANFAFVGGYAPSDFAPAVLDSNKTGILIRHV